MKFFFTAFLLSLSGFQQPVAGWWPTAKCLSDGEANDIANRWLDIWWTGAITSRSQLESIVAEDVASYDEAFGGPTLSLDELFGILTIGGPSKVTDVTQKPLFLIHSCDGIAVRWQYLGITTGYNS